MIAWHSISLAFHLMSLLQVQMLVLSEQMRFLPVDWQVEVDTQGRNGLKFSLAGLLAVSCVHLPHMDWYPSR